MKTYSSIPADERKNSINCNLCGSTEKRLYWDCGDYTFSKCNNCGLIYQYPQPVQTDLSLRYDDKYFEYEIENEKAFFGLMLKTLDDIKFNSRSSFFLEGSAEFLDIGCATGMLLANMETLGWKGRGVELCPASAEYGKNIRKQDIFNGTLEAAGYADNQFSVVHSSHLIEHLTDPAAYVQEVFRILKPGGLFITTTPNSSSLQAKLFGKNWRSAIADHMYLFSVGTLTKLIETMDFKVLQTGTWGGLAAGIVPKIIKKPADLLAKKLGFGDVMVVLAQKR
ncbi:MAG: class I SAM-dependent methyltransferase [Spirochaetales bacterium]|nr:class I SAM-dependent methyltransferase [Spirochaetales bacterium]